jgi:glutamate N-acetyltransferase/amino-acid N-acetyltransferase
MTTDTIAKACSRSIVIDGKTVTLTGIAKGSGMIRPDMATMLAFIATDARVDSGWLQACLTAAVNDSFNSITVDGDTSTNDACVLIATGASDCETLSDAHKEKEKFVSALNEISLELAQAIVRDAEGASKFVTVRVDAASNAIEARDVAYTIAHSPLVKTALFASDPNWGRILAAVGRAGVKELDIDTIKIYLDDVCIVSEGGRDAAYTEEAGQHVMNQDEIMIRVVLNRGQDSATIWTSDLSHDYVTINSEYRT